MQKRKWGYVVWFVAGVIIAVPEITAAVDGDALPFTTISATVGHLERRWNIVELAVVAVIVFLVFFTVRLRPPQQPPPGEQAGQEGPAGPPAPLEPGRTPGGRLKLGPARATDVAAARFDDERAPVLFAILGAVSLVIVAVATWATVHWANDKDHYRPGYVLYGLLFLFWFAIPGLIAFLWDKDAPFPTLFRTVKNLEDWLSTIRFTLFSRPIGPMLGWFVSFVILWGLVVLLLHLTLYPYPDITHILNPNG